MSPEEAADRLAIMDKIYCYCRSVDRLDVPVGHAVFHPDSHAVFPAWEGPGRGWIDFICEEHRKFLHHSHQVTNVIIEVDGETAGSESYVFANLRQARGEQVIHTEIWARYIDSWSKRGGEWAIDRRDCIVDFNAERAVDPLPTDGRAQRDGTDPSYTVLKG